MTDYALRGKIPLVLFKSVKIFIFRELEKWTPINTEKNLAKVSGNLHQVKKFSLFLKLS